jgi:hypothetical protein
MSSPLEEVVAAASHASADANPAACESAPADGAAPGVSPGAAEDERAAADALLDEATKQSMNYNEQ